MSSIIDHLDAISFDAEHDNAQGLGTNSPSVTLVDAVAAVKEAEQNAFRASAQFIADDAKKQRLVDTKLADALDQIAADLRKHARRIGRLS